MIVGYLMEILEDDTHDAPVQESNRTIAVRELDQEFLEAIRVLL
jgi:hypothetical protein